MDAHSWISAKKRNTPQHTCSSNNLSYHSLLRRYLFFESGNLYSQYFLVSLHFIYTHETEILFYYNTHNLRLSKQAVHGGGTGRVGRREHFQLEQSGTPRECHSLRRRNRHRRPSLSRIALLSQPQWHLEILLGRRPCRLPF